MRLRLYLRVICKCGAVERPVLPETATGKESKAYGIDIYEDYEGKQCTSEPFELPKNYSKDKEKAIQYWNKVVKFGDNRTKEYVNKKLKLLSD